MSVLLGILQKNMGDPYYEPTTVVHDKSYLECGDMFTTFTCFASNNKGGYNNINLPFIFYPFIDCSIRSIILMYKFSFM